MQMFSSQLDNATKQINLLSLYLQNDIYNKLIS